MTVSVPVRAYVGLGSNLDQPQQQVLQALQALDRIPATRLVAHSRLYRSAPIGPAGQPDYINAVAALDTALEPHALLHALQAIEQRHGRVRALRWGPRTLDLDLLLYGDVRLADAELTVPHPEMLNRNFVLYPLFEIAPALRLPDNGTLREWVSRMAADGLEVLEA